MSLRKLGFKKSAFMVEVPAFSKPSITAPQSARDAGKALSTLFQNPAFRRFALPLAAAATAYGTMRGTERISDWRRRRKFDKDKERLFQEMLGKHPDLKEKEDLAAEYFDALSEFSPSVIRSPLAAGAYIKQAIEQHHAAGGPLPQMVRALTEIEKDIVDARDKRRASPLVQLVGQSATETMKQAPTLMGLGF